MADMQELEKILEEIEEQRSYEADHAWNYARGLEYAANIIRKHMNDGWIPVSEQFPETDDYILLSFANFSLPMVGRYEKDSDGGAFYLGDCDEEDTCISQDLFVNTWMPLPEPYREEKDVER